MLLYIFTKVRNDAGHTIVYNTKDNLLSGG